MRFVARAERRALAADRAAPRDRALRSADRSSIAVAIVVMLRASGRCGGAHSRAARR